MKRLRPNLEQKDYILTTVPEYAELQEKFGGDGIIKRRVRVSFKNGAVQYSVDLYPQLISTTVFDGSFSLSVDVLFNVDDRVDQFIAKLIKVHKLNPQLPMRLHRRGCIQKLIFTFNPAKPPESTQIPTLRQLGFHDGSAAIIEPKKTRWELNSIPSWRRIWYYAKPGQDTFQLKEASNRTRAEWSKTEYLSPAAKVLAVESGAANANKVGICCIITEKEFSLIGAILESLAHIPVIANYYISNRYLEDINIKNKFGSRGEISKVFAEVIHNYWSGKYSSITPHCFTNTFMKWFPELHSNLWKDAHKFLSLLLNVLHEDVNKNAIVFFLSFSSILFQFIS